MSSLGELSFDYPEKDPVLYEASIVFVGTVNVQKSNPEINISFSLKREASGIFLTLVLQSSVSDRNTIKFGAFNIDEEWKAYVLEVARRRLDKEDKLLPIKVEVNTTYREINISENITNEQ